MFDWLFGARKYDPRQLNQLAQRLDIHALRKRVKIVVIDDDENAFPIKKLQEDGFTIEYWNKVKAIEKLERGEFDIIVLDIGGVADKKLSSEDGLGVLEHLKKVNPNQIVVAFSGQSFDLGKSKFFRVADDTLAKPVDVLKCVQVLDNLILTKFNINNLWDLVVAILKKDKLPDGTVAQFESAVVGAIEKKQTDYSGIVKSFVDKADTGVKVVELVTKISEMFNT